MVALMCSQPLRACPESIFPPVSDNELLIAPERVESLLDKSKMARASECDELAADLAQLFFWGVGIQPVDFTAAARQLAFLQALSPGDATLRLLEPAVVLLGKSARLDVDEAMRRYLREINSGDALRRDKALAVLNQLAREQPKVNLQGQPLYLDAGRHLPAPAAQRGVILDADQGRLLVDSGSGMPALRWISPGLELPALAGPMAFFAHRAPGADQRRQQWQMPSQSLTTGLLRSGFGQRDQFLEIQCTATVIGPQWLLTAAHCLSAPDGGDEVLQQLAFAWRGERWVVSQAWRHQEHRAGDQQRGNVDQYSGSDVALLALAAPLPVTDFPRLASPDSEVEIYSFGYPQDKAPGTLWASECRGQLRRPDGPGGLRVYRLDCSNTVGQSGSAVIDKARPDTVYGVLSARVREQQDDFNVFAAFSPALVKDIQRLISGDTAIQASGRSRFLQRYYAAPEVISRK